MAINFDIGKVRSITSGEVNGSARFLALFFCACATWIAAARFSNMAKSAVSTLALQQSRYHSLSLLAAEYRTIADSPVQRGNDFDVMAVFTQVSALIDLGNRVTRIVPTPDGKRCSVEVGRLYVEEMANMVNELTERGVYVISAEIRALPVGQERLFTLTAVIGAGA